MRKKSKKDHDEEAEAAVISDTGKDIKKGMDRYEARMKSAAEEEGEAPPAGDSTRSEE